MAPRMSILARLFRPRPDVHTRVRPLWHRVVEIAREKQWYTTLGIADTLPGRFDAITLVLVLVLLRMEAEPELAAPSVHLTELFVDDMDGQLRESGVGDVVVGKHIGRQMSVLGGRLGALREAFAPGADDAALIGALTRNITLRDGVEPGPLAAAVRAFSAVLATVPADRLLAGDFTR
jgi:cytochrome b pre-mRNA-processing protein 3